MAQENPLITPDNYPHIYEFKRYAGMSSDGDIWFALCSRGGYVRGRTCANYRAEKTKDGNYRFAVPTFSTCAECTWYLGK